MTKTISVSRSPGKGRMPRLAKSAALIAASALAMVILAVLAVQLPPLQRAVANAAANTVVRSYGFDAEVDGTGGIWPWRITAASIRLADEQGEFIELRDIELRMRPQALLFGRVAIDRLAVGGGTYSRQPLAPSPEPFRLPTFSSLPGGTINLDISSIEVAGFLVAIGGDQVTIEGGGYFRLNPSGLESDLAFAAGDAGQASFTATIDAAARAVNLTAQVSDPAGRWLAPLTPLAPGTPIGARISARGPNDDIVLGARADWGEARLEMDGAAVWGGSLRVDLAGAVDNAAPPPLRDLMGPRQEFEGRFEVAQDGGLTIETISATSAVWDAALAGVVADRLALDAEITLLQPERFARHFEVREIGAAHAALRIEGTPGTPRVRGTVDLARIAGDGMAADDVRLTLEALISRDGASAEGSLHLESAGVSGSLLPPALARQQLALLSEFRVDFDRQRADVRSLSGTMGPLTLAGEGEIAADGPMRFEGAVTTADLSALDPRLAGTGHLAGSARRLRRGAPLELTLNGSTDAFSAAGDLAALFGAAPSLRAEASITAEHIALTSLSAALGAASLEGQGEIDRIRNEIDFRGGYTVSDLSVFRAGISGAADGEMMVRGAVSAPRTGFAFRSARIQAAGVETTDVVGQLDDNEGEGRLVIDATVNGSPFRATYSYARSGADIDGEIALALAGFEVSGPLGVEGGAPRAQLRAGADDIEPLVTVLRAYGGTADDLRAHGALAAELSVAGGQGELSVTLTGPSIDGINIPADASEISLRALLDLDGAPSLDGQLTAENTRFGPSRFSIVDAKAQGPLTDLSATLSLRGPVDEPFYLEADARRHEAGAGSQIGLSAVRGQSLDFEVEMVEGGSFTIGPDGVDLAPTVLAVRNLATEREGVLGVEARLWAGAPFARLTADNVPAGSLAVFGLPVDWTGILNGEVTLNPRAGQAPLRVAVMATELTNDPDIAPLDMRLTVEATGRSLDGELWLTDTASSAPLVAARSTVPLIWQAGRFTPVIDWSAPLEGGLRADAPLERLWLFVPVDTMAIRGRINADVTLAGTLGTPNAHGDIAIAQGTLEHFQSGFLLRDGTGTVSFSEVGILTADIRSTDGNGGRAHLRASAHLPREENWVLDGTLDLDGLILARRDELQAKASGSLRLAGSLAQARLDGIVTMDRIEARIPNQMPPSVVDLPIVRINGETRENIRTQTGNGKRTLNIPVDLDVRVDIPRRAFVRGRGLDSEWNGALQIGGTIYRPRLDGTLSIVRGTFDLSRSRFDLTQGQIEFLGGDRINPQVRIEGQAPGPAFTSIILARGPARRPTITITSDPVMPQETVMAQILFGKRPDELSAFELVQIAEASASLSGSGGIDLLGSARRTTGLDVLSIGARETATGGQDVDVTVGRYVAPNVFVGARRGLEPGSGAVTVEMEVTPQITVDAEVRQDAEGSVGVDWRWDY